MRKTILFCILLSSGFSCSFYKSSIKKSIRFISFESSLQLAIAKDSVITTKAELLIAYYQDYTLYKSPTIRERYKHSSLEDSVGTLTMRDTVYQYYMVKKGDRYGLRYDAVNMIIGKKFPLDSLLKYKGIDTANHAAFGHDWGTPVETRKNRKSNKIEFEKYIIQKKSVNDPDTICRYYDERLANIDFSLSPKLDKEKQNKLWKTLYIMKASPESEKRYPFDAPQIEHYWTFTELAVKDQTDYLTLFERFKEQSESIDMNKK